MSRHLTIITIGSRGDVQPYVALGRGLQTAGFGVRLATHELFRDFVADHGLEFAPLAGDPQAMLDTPEGQAWLESDRNPVQFLRYFIRLSRPRLRQNFADSVVACRGTDAIIYSSLGVTGYHVAEMMGIPAIMTALQPYTPTTAFPAVGAKTPPISAGWINYLSHLVVQQALWLPFRDLVNEWRQASLGLEPLPLWGPYRRQRKEKHPVLYGYSPAVIPRPDDWPPWMQVTGYWFLQETEKEEWRPPPDLQAFLDAGDPPVYIGFGSMRDRDPAQLERMVETAVSRSGVRAIVLSGWSGMQPRSKTDDIFVVDAAPHDWLFPRVTAVVHHGGAGTTAAGLRAGKPSLLIPYFADQHFWGRRVAILQAGPAPIPRAELTADALSRALQQAYYHPHLRRRAATVGRAIRAEDGVAQAVAHVQQILNSV